MKLIEEKVDRTSCYIFCMIPQRLENPRVHLAAPKCHPGSVESIHLKDGVLRNGEIKKEISRMSERAKVREVIMLAHCNR